jgi:hypothetical protein
MVLGLRTLWFLCFLEVLVGPLEASGAVISLNWGLRLRSLRLLLINYLLLSLIDQGLLQLSRLHSLVHHLLLRL